MFSSAAARLFLTSSLRACAVASSALRNFRRSAGSAALAAPSSLLFAHPLPPVARVLHEVAAQLRSSQLGNDCRLAALNLLPAPYN